MRARSQRAGPGRSSGTKSPLRVDARGAARVVQQHQRQQAARPRRSSGMQARSRRPRRIASLHSSPRISRSPRRGGVALVEDQVDDREHGREAVGQLIVGRHAVGDAGRRRSCAWRATSRCAIVGSATRNARAISPSSGPPSERRVSATRAFERERRVAACEDQPQAVVADRRLLGSVLVGARGVEPARSSAERARALGERAVAPQPVDRPAARGGSDPGGGVRRARRRAATSPTAAAKASCRASSASWKSPSVADERGQNRGRAPRGTPARRRRGASGRLSVTAG